VNLISISSFLLILYIKRSKFYNVPPVIQEIIMYGTFTGTTKQVSL